MPRFGRRVYPDARDERFPAKAALPPKPPAKPYRFWYNRGARLNQGSTGTCVAHGWAHLAENSPITRKGTLDPFELYREIVLRDEWLENDREATGPIDGMQFGTSVRAGAKVLVDRGLISEYRWGENLDDVVDWIHRRGQVVAGFNWHEGMLNKDSRGFIHATGSIVGGHCVVLDGVNMNREYVRGLNSWTWGPFWLSFADLDRLLTQDGEACMPQEVSRAVDR